MNRVHRFLFVCVTLSIVIALYHVSYQIPKLKTPSFSGSWPLNKLPIGDHSKSPSKSSQKGSSSKLLEPLKTDSRFVSWLSARIPVDRVPFITIGDCKYIHALRNFHDRLDQWGYRDDLVVICLDQCCADARDYHAYTRYIGESVAFVKVRIILKYSWNLPNCLSFRSTWISPQTVTISYSSTETHT
jgi:hypothetical protein